MSDKFSKFIQHEIDSINLHLPRKVLSLSMLLRLKEPVMKTRDNNIIEFDKDELEFIKDKIPQSAWNQVQLPIIITRRRDKGKSAYSISGGDPNVYLILSLFDDLGSYEYWRLNKREDYTIYKYQLRRIRKKFPTVSIIAFA